MNVMGRGSNRRRKKNGGPEVCKLLYPLPTVLTSWMVPLSRSALVLDCSWQKVLQMPWTCRSNFSVTFMISFTAVSFTLATRVQSNSCSDERIASKDGLGGCPKFSGGLGGVVRVYRCTDVWFGRVVPVSVAKFPTANLAGWGSGIFVQCQGTRQQSIVGAGPSYSIA